MTSAPVDPAAIARDGVPGAAAPGAIVLEALVGRLPSGPLLRVAAGIADQLATLHRAGSIHGDIRPSNILVSLESGRAWFIGGGSYPEPRGGDGAALAYAAPERAARLGGVGDGRSDLYSLGVSLYELATGKLPFAASEPKWWAHAHVAARPIPPREQAAMPEMLERILLTLLEKEPEDRYQTAAGLAHDLRECEARLDPSGEVPPFPLGRRDAPGRLLGPSAFHGRARELDVLGSAFERVRATGVSEIVLVSGPSGVGKSCLLDEAVGRFPRGTIVAGGKFEDLEGDAPYRAMVRALSGPCRWLLTKPASMLEEWRTALAAELGANAGVVAELVPDLRSILGATPPVARLPTKDVQRRLEVSVQRFLRVFASRQPPLVLFLDDLQWLDAASLALLERLLLDPELCSVLLLGAHRSESVAAEHPLEQTRLRWVAAGRAVTALALPPLESSEVGRLVADILFATREQAEDLARVVAQKTGGNPFFVGHFLGALVDEKLLSFDSHAGAWAWELPLIAAKGVTDNLTVLLLERLTRLPESTRRALELLACAGGRANTALLAQLAAISLEAQTEQLRPAVHAGVIVKSGPGYAFAHDRLLSTTYSSISEAERATLHLRIGNALRAQEGGLEGDTLPEVVRQLNRGSGLITDVRERIELAELNLAFARRSRAIAMSGAVGAQLDLAFRLLPADHWERVPDLSFELVLARAESSFLCDRHADAQRLLGELRTREVGMERLASVVALQIALSCAAFRFDEAIDTGLEYLRAAGLPCGAIDQEEARRQYERLLQILGTRQIASLYELPALDSPSVRAVMEVCDAMLVASRSAGSPLLAILAMQMAALSIEHGNSDISVFAYATLSMILGPHFDEHELGLEFGKLGARLAEAGENRFVARARLLMGSVVVPRTQDAHAGRAWLIRAREVADRFGDLVCSVYSRSYSVVGLLCSGAPLQEVELEAEKAIAYAACHGFALAADRVRIMQAFVRGLRDPAREPGTLSVEGLDEDEYERRLEDNSNRYYYWHWRVKARYYAGQFAEARAAAKRSRALAHIAPASQEESDLLLFGALAETACADPAAPSEALEATLDDERELLAWAARCPATFASKAALVSAERARLDGRHADAEQSFERAAETARQYELLHEEALAHELAAGFYAARGVKSVARAKLGLARACYLRWGAKSKVLALDAAADSFEEGAPLATAAEVLEQLDVKLLVSGLEAVSSSLDLETLIRALMTAALEVAAAERGSLVLLTGASREPRVRATAVSEPTSIRVVLDDSPLSTDGAPVSILNYVIRSCDRVLVRGGVVPPPFGEDTYFATREVRSLTCLPIVVRGQAIGAMYLENVLARQAEYARGLAMLDLVAAQAGVSLENAQLYAGLRETQQRMARAERVSRTASFSFRPRTLEGNWSEEVSSIYAIEGRPTLAQLRDRTHPDDRALFDDMLRDCWRYEGSSVELRLLMPDGVVRYVAIIGSRLGTADEYVGTIRDVTDAKHAEEALERTQAALMDMTRMASLAEMSAAIAHEVNQPVAAIALDAGNCLRRLDGERLDLKKARALVERIQRDASRAGTIVQRLRALFRHSEHARVGVDLNDAISEVVTLARSRIRAAKVTLTLELGAVPVVLGDRVQLQQVIMNLLNNALDAMSRESSPRSLTIRTLPAEFRRVACEVRDSGPGLSDADRVRIFEPFYTTKLEGMGMGLSICTSIVTQHGGELSVRSNAPDLGATFSFTVPCKEGQP